MSRKLLFEWFYTYKQLETSHLIPFDKNIKLNEHLRSLESPSHNLTQSRIGTIQADEHSLKTGLSHHILIRVDDFGVICDWAAESICGISEDSFRCTPTDCEWSELRA